MGAYSPLADLSDEDIDRIVATVHRPILAELARRGTPFRGFLYAGMILTETGPHLLECNARLGDPEAQVILPRLASPVGPLLLAGARGALPGDGATRAVVIPGASVGIVLASSGYPNAPRRGDEIVGLDEAAAGALVFHAGTTKGPDGAFLTNGGRVLTVVGRGGDLAAARRAAEHAADRVSWAGMLRRRDIAAIVPGAVGVAAGAGR
jgi:phosphoribosylamine--glycine ligase